MNSTTMDIDLVYLWVDGSDPAWMARKRAACGIEETAEKGASETDCKARWIDNEELRYSLRSAEKFAPWVRLVFIVTDGQTPAWLDTSNPRVRVVDHSEILPPEALPCFNSVVIEYFLHRIPGLAEHFIYANDDTFFGAPVAPEFFFDADGRPIVRLVPKAFGKLRYAVKRASGIGFGYYRRSLFLAAREVERLTGRYYSAVPHHNIDAYRVSDYQLVTETLLADRVAGMLHHHMRTEGDLQRVAISYWALATGRAVEKPVRGKSESVRVKIHKPGAMEDMRRHSPALFCLNDSQRASDDDRARIRPFLEGLFPEPSEFEKPGR